MMKIDAHQHFWKYDPVRDAWIDDRMAVLKRDFLPEHLEPLLQHNGIDGCVVVQSDQSEQENVFQLANAQAHDFIKGIVGWTDLQAANIEERLEYYSQFKKLKGFRHVIQVEPQRDFMLRPAFINGVSHLRKYDYTYDILIHADQLKYADTFVKLLPGQPFVIDHLAKPLIKDKLISTWKMEMQAIAKYENVCCKISGMVTEADWHNWVKDDFYPYMDVIVESFGTKRIMFGSDWPVCMLAADYSEALNIVKEYFSAYSKTEQEQIFGGNAIKFYNLQ